MRLIRAEHEQRMIEPIAPSVELQSLGSVYLRQFDVTQDYLGTFYGGINWRAKWLMIQEELNLYFQTEFGDNQNSFGTCFQFAEKSNEDRLYKRVKIYNKFLALFQSETTMTALGMNTKAIFYPPYCR